MATVKDVAILAQVSTATVSRVLTGRNRVEDHTKEKVLKAMKELNYRPNFLGKQLRELQTNNILVVIPDFSNSFFYDILQGIELEAIDQGYEILIKNMKHSGSENLDYFKYLHQKQVAGIILLAIGEEERLKNLSDDRLVLACAYLDDSDIPNVSIDNTQSAYDVTKHLIDQGHCNIAFLSGGLKTISSGDRFKGYEQALIDANIPVRRSLILEGDYSFQSGIELTKQLLKKGEFPTAIFAASDQMAVGAMKAINMQGLSVPSDVAIVGFDDIELAAMVDPELTTISQPSYDIGKTAMQMMHQLISNEKIKKKQVKLDGRLIIRDSCGTKKVL